MPTLIAGILAVLILYIAVQAFRAADPHRLARFLKIAGGVASLGVAIILGLRGQLAIAIPLGVFGLGLLGWAPFAPAGFSSRSSRSSGQASRVRSAFLEMELDHDTGALSGRVIAGPHAGTVLENLDLSALLSLRASFDDDSRALLESYLDRRFSTWRAHVKEDATGRRRGASSGGKMTDEEAYQILGLQPGASRDEITRAHRSLMKKLHPDQGGSTYLATRVNEAKDILLRRHRS